ncbi:glycosyltransferase family 1 protein [Acinetobacter sp. RF15A]|uniref:glycosyltransferase family 4 protein n=1 Tax=unclassified Acinetobacter TaxID=196816 RepID=UPI00116DE38E|nr:MULTISPECIES: glycosyltransferase family 1 protein [unclassified Acinetobacter]TQR67176.1 glycosyltransferase family 1 protein [Acinetobacter sp. RF14B]TSH74668.1 glycosyltransferase family 1 protein [Acinetobacter sp. RF15A]TSI17239.1 glycosyltransferase family 1 protein [Acinetobacter sp. RF15B]
MSQTSISELLKHRPVLHKIQFDLKGQRRPVSPYKTALESLVCPRLKIAIVTETWPPEINGVAHSLLQLCKGLQKQGHKILLIRPEQQKTCSEFKAYAECLVKAHHIPRYAHLQFGRPQFLKIYQAVEDFYPDLVHIVTEGPLGLVAQQVAKLQGIPVSSGFHSSFQDFSRFFDLAFLVKPIQNYLKWFHNNTALTCVPSQETAQALTDFGVTCRLAVVGRGVDTDTFSPKWRSPELRYAWGVSATTRVMLYVGRLSPEKEVNVLIQVYLRMRQLYQQNIRLVIVGDGPDRARLERLNQDGSVIFTGSLSGQKLSQAYASADVFCFASQVETFGNVVLEAMASGLPVIAYDYACAHLHIRHGQTGYLSARGNQQAFIQNMLELPDLLCLQQMGSLARQKAEEVGWQYPVYQFEQALYSVVQPEKYRA